jgi:hypothetical protein
MMGLVLHKGQVILVDLNIWKHDIDWIFVNFLLKFIMEYICLINGVVLC